MRWLIFFIVLWSSRIYALEQASVPVTTAPLSALVKTIREDAPAEVVSLSQTKVPAQVGALISTFHVRVGDRVTHLQPLVSLDCTDLELIHEIKNNELRLAKNNQRLASREWSRAKKLAEGNTIGIAELDARTTEFKRSQLQVALSEQAVAQSKLNVERCQVLAPMGAVVTRRLAHEGEYVFPGTPIVELVSLTDIEVSAFVPLSSLSDFSSAQQYWFEVWDKKVNVVVRSVLPVVDRSSLSKEVRLAFSQTDSWPEVGRVGRVVWASDQPSLPAAYVLKRNDQLGFFTYESQTKTARFHVLPGALEGRPAQLPPSLYDDQENVQVIIEGRHGLLDQQSVTVVTQ